jgi:hypothetical protein
MNAHGTPTFYTSEFEATLLHLRNITSILLYAINTTVATAVGNNKSAKNCRILQRP